MLVWVRTFAEERHPQLGMKNGQMTRPNVDFNNGFAVELHSSALRGFPLLIAVAHRVQATTLVPVEARQISLAENAVKRVMVAVRFDGDASKEGVDLVHLPRKRGRHWICRVNGQSNTIPLRSPDELRRAFQNEWFRDLRWPRVRTKVPLPFCWRNAKAVSQHQQSGRCPKPGCLPYKRSTANAFNDRDQFGSLGPVHDLLKRSISNALATEAGPSHLSVAGSVRLGSFEQITNERP